MLTKCTVTHNNHDSDSNVYSRVKRYFIYLLAVIKSEFSFTGVTFAIKIPMPFNMSDILSSLSTIVTSSVMQFPISGKKYFKSD